MFYHLIRIGWGLWELKLSPQDLPYSMPLLGLFVVINMLFNWFQLSYQQLTVIQGFYVSFSMLFVTGLYIYFILSIRQYQPRFVQTFIGVNGVSLIVNIILFPLVLLQPLVFQKGDATASTQFAALLYLIIIIPVNIWLLVAMSNVFRHAFDTKFWIGFLITLSVGLVDYFTFLSLVGVPK